MRGDELAKKPVKKGKKPAKKKEPMPKPPMKQERRKGKSPC
jgi:hypothetical protein